MGVRGLGCKMRAWCPGAASSCLGGPILGQENIVLAVLAVLARLPKHHAHVRAGATYWPAICRRPHSIASHESGRPEFSAIRQRPGRHCGIRVGASAFYVRTHWVRENAIGGFKEEHLGYARTHRWRAGALPDTVTTCVTRCVVVADNLSSALSPCLLGANNHSYNDHLLVGLSP